MVTAWLAVALCVLTGCTVGGSPSGGGEAGAAPPQSAIAVSPAGGNVVSPTTPIVVTATSATLGTVTVTNPADGKTVTGALSPDKRTWTSNEPLGYGADYAVVADAVDGSGKTIDTNATVRTVAPDVTTYPSFIPDPTATDSWGVGQIIGVSFDHDVTDRAAAVKALSVQSVPPQPGAWYWIDAKTVHYRPQNYWQPGTTITLSANIYGVDLGGGVYGRTDRTATYKIHDSWIAKADGNTDQLTIFHNGVQVNQMPMSLGSPGHPSHEGPHVISDKQNSVVMDSCSYGVCAGAPGYYKETVYLDEQISADGEYVHSAPWSVGEQGESNVSHGCVNLSPENAQWFFDHFNLGDVVEVTNSGGPKLPVWDTYGDWEVPWNVWQQGGLDN
ncbi:L,D-transpeptidase [Rhodococcus sp. D2-41]|uniref:L,D-transpeptidase n=1 Tax=Speluncibacter jeojiensis TaxID=2710754 RepID=UPI002410418D|nr:Ig-like domain-containing protein [Rhodococcus sp. D2-41]MDG3010218.1 L,D-transpeptidase [Rhodococcus sp. D2-41]